MNNKNKQLEKCIHNSKVISTTQFYNIITSIVSLTQTRPLPVM